MTTRVAAECAIKVYLRSRTREETTACERGLERSEAKRGTANAAVYEVPRRAERCRAPPLAQAPCWIPNAHDRHPTEKWKSDSSSVDTPLCTK